MRRHPRILAGVCLAYAALAVYWVAAYAGPGEWLGELQFEMLGRYTPLWSLLVLYAPPVVLLRVVGALPSSDPLDTLAGGLAGWAHDLFRPLLIVGAGLAVGGVLWSQATATSRGIVPVADLPSPDTGAFHGELEGFLDDGGISVSKGKGMYAVFYRPLRTARSDRGPASVIVEVQENEVEEYVRAGADGQVRVRGLADTRLEGVVRSGLRNQGVELTDPCWVVHTRASPRGARWALAAIGLLTLGIAAVALARNRRDRAAGV